MQIADDSTYSYNNGLAIGPISDPLVAGQRGGGTALTYKRSFFVSGASDTQDRGTSRYHYDLIATMTNKNTGALSLTLKVYNHNPLYDADPAGYASLTPVLTLTGSKNLSANVDHQILFFAERYDNTGDSYAQKRAKIAVDNVFVESPYFHNPTVTIVPVPDNDLSKALGVQPNDDLQKAFALNLASITASPGLQWDSVSALADAKSSTDRGSSTAVKDGASGGTIDIWFDPAYSMNRPLSDITITVHGATDDRRYWDFDLLYGMSNDPSSFQMLFSGKDSTMAAGVGTQIRLSNFTVPVAPFDTLRLVLRPSPTSPYHATTLLEIDVNFVPEPSGFGLALGFALLAGIGYTISNRRRKSHS